MLTAIAWIVILTTGAILLATVCDRWYRQFDIDVEAIEKEFDMGLPKEEHVLIVVDENPHRESKHRVRCEPTWEARGKIVYAVSSEHESVYLYCPPDVLVAACHMNCLPAAKGQR